METKFYYWFFPIAMLTLGVSAFSVKWTINVANRLRWFDFPNERSSHSAPTPRIGGAPIALFSMFFFIIMHWLGLPHVAINLAVLSSLLFALAMAGLGLWDDMRHLSVSFRMIVQLFSAFLILWIQPAHLFTSAVPFWKEVPIFWILGSTLWIVWMANLYNFKDGIDGLAGGQAVVASLFFFLLFCHHKQYDWAIANLVIAACAAGFLLFNWHPARIFMGDAGSLFLGAFYGMQSILVVLTTPVSFLACVVPFANFINDTSITLLCRVWRGEKWYMPHREFLHHRMIDLGMSHARVATFELALCFGCCLVIGVVSLLGWKWQVVATILLIPVFAFYWGWVSREENGSKRAGFPEKQIALHLDNI